MADLQAIYSFGPFRLDTLQRVLWKDGVPVKLTATELSVLLVLLERPGQVVEKAALIEAAWGPTNVEEVSLRQAVARLRKKLGPKSHGLQYIETSHNQGYYFAETVSKEPLARDDPHPKNEEPEPVPDPFPQIAQPRAVHPKWGIGIGLTSILVAVAIVLTGMVVRRPAVMPLSVTDDGYRKLGPLKSDGHRLYFFESVDEKPVLAQVSTAGGEVTRTEVPGLAWAQLLDIRKPGPEFLIFGETPQNQGFLWAWRPGSSPRKIAPATATNGAAWVSEDTLADVRRDGPLLRLIRNGVVRSSLRLPAGSALSDWSPVNHLMTLSVPDPSTSMLSVWEWNGSAPAPRPVLGLPPDAGDAIWEAGGRRFAFVSPATGRGDVWITSMTDGSQRSAKPVRLTNGPFSYSHPLPAPDGREVFAIGSQERAELVRYDPAKRRFHPLLPGTPAFEVDFSRGGSRLAYIRYPERSLWTSRIDGSGAVRLTSPPMVAIEPHWSPDGTQIAFMGQDRGGERRIYLIPADGGTPREALSGGPPQGVPTWSADGDSIVFGEPLSDKPAAAMTIRVLNLKTRSGTKLSGSDGLWTPRWSPDGAFISALTPDFRQLKLFDCRTGRWKNLAAMWNIDHPHWTADSAYIYFRGVVHVPGVAEAHRAIYRVHVRTCKVEEVADLDGFPLPGFEWFGVTPDGTPLGLRSVMIQNIYAIRIP